MKLAAALVFALALSGPASPAGPAGGGRPTQLPANPDRVRDRTNDSVYVGDQQCANDQYGKVFCAQSGGSAMRDSGGTVVCGKGACVKDGYGEVWCSAESGGGAALDSYNKAKCPGGCERASASNCTAGE